MPPLPSALTGKEGVCRIEVARVTWHHIQPWQRLPQTKGTGTGFVIEGERLLTNAHVVQSAVDIRVRPHGSTRRFPATVTVYAPDVDLAILQIKGEQEKADFFYHPVDAATATAASTSMETDVDIDTAAMVTDDADAVTTSTDGTPASSSSSSSSSNENNNNKHRRKKSLALKFAEELPALQESVHVVGFPTGGRTICVTEGVVSRIDLMDRIVAIQVDSAINPGNSGGPAFNSKGQVTGVAFRKRVTTSKSSKVDNIGYLIPAVLVRSFLGRCHASSDGGTYTLSPRIPYRWHSLENHSLRLAHAVPDTVHGILLTSVCESLGGALQKDDVLTKIDESDVADDGQVTLRGDELIQHAYLMRIKKMDEPVVFHVYRHCQHLACPPCILRDIPCIIPRWETVDYQPEYLILGALVLLPFSLSLKANKNCGPRLSADCIDWYARWPSEWEDKEGLVLLTDIFAHELSFSYSRPWRRVVGYNGTPIKSLKHLRDLWQESCDAVSNGNKDTTATTTTTTSTSTTDEPSPQSATPSSLEAPPTFARLELENDDDIVFEVKAAIRAQKELMETHEIKKQSQIIPFNPKYKR